MGTDTLIPYNVIQQSRIFVERSPDKIEKLTSLSSQGDRLAFKQLRTLTSSVVAISNIIPAGYVSPPPDPEFEKFKGMYIHSIYTDGSRSVKHSLSSFLLDTGEIKNLSPVRRSSSRR
jgi:hypothetical protein